MPRRRLHDEDEEVTTVGHTDDLGPIEDEDDEFGYESLLDDPEDEDEDLFDYDDEEEEFLDEEE